MPNQSHSGIHGDPWHSCDICGFDWRTSQLRRQPGLRRGLLVCPKCYDDPLTFYRDIVIQDTLSRLNAYDFITSGTSAPTTPTRNGVADFSWNFGASLGPINFSCSLLGDMATRTGFGEDLQEQFGGTGIPASAQQQIYRPDVSAGQSTGQEITPRTALKIKGIKPLSFKLTYLITGAALTAHTCRIDNIT